MLYEGMTSQGLQVIQAIRDRYDGHRRNPFDEAECGHHYARAMASWGAILALSGFHYSAVAKTMQFARSPKPVQWFWSTGDAWGTFHQRPERNGTHVEIQVLGGSTVVRHLRLGQTTFDLHKDIRLTTGKTLRWGTNGVWKPLLTRTP
jgi:hypothetical protein